MGPLTHLPRVYSHSLINILKSRMGTGAIFNAIHEVHRHAIHTSDNLQATVETLSEMQHRRIEVQKRLQHDLGETYREQARDYAQFQISMFKSLKLRSDSIRERLKNEITLVNRPPEPPARTKV